MRDFHKPILASINGLAVGGGLMPAPDLAGHTATFARKIAQMPTLQLALARMEVLKGLTLDDPNVSMMIEMFGLGVSQRSHDYEEGHASFTERREPRFLGR